MSTGINEIGPVFVEPDAIVAMTPAELVTMLERLHREGKVLTSSDYALACLAGGLVEFKGPRINAKRNYYFGGAGVLPEVVTVLAKHLASIYATHLASIYAACVAEGSEDEHPWQKRFAVLGMPDKGWPWAEGFVEGWPYPDQIHLMQNPSTFCPPEISEAVVVDNCGSGGSLNELVIREIRDRGFDVYDCVVPFCRGEGAPERLSHLIGGPVRVLAATSINTAAPLWQKWGRKRGVPSRFASRAFKLRELANAVEAARQPAPPECDCMACVAENA